MFKGFKQLDIKSNKKIKIAAIVFFAITLIILSIPVVYAVAFWGKISPGVSVAGIDIGGLSESEAVNLLTQEVKTPEKIELGFENDNFTIPAKEIGLRYDHEKTVLLAQQTNQSDSLITDIINRIDVLINKKDVPIVYYLDEDSLRNNLSVVAGQLSIEPVEPNVSYSPNGIIVTRGQPGKDVDVEKLFINVLTNIQNIDHKPIIIEVVEVDPTISDEQAEELRSRAESIIEKSLILFYDDIEFVIEKNDMLNLLSYEGVKLVVYDQILLKAAKQFERNPQNAVFQFQDGKVQEFKPAKEGLQINAEELRSRLINVYKNIHELEDIKITIEVPVYQTPPAITTSEVNDLGIQELLGKGDSTYRGSIPNRVYNVDLAASKFNGILVEPGGIFSFNEIIGDISVYSGYKQAYVIMGGKTVLGDGGGVCQVSTTIFRAALDAGLPIVERSPHSYRVGYYEQGYKAGLDATIYSPITDFKFKNDTPNHILIQTISNPANYYLAFEIYGTSDGRVSKITNHYITSPVPPPEDLYVDDPALPEGEVKQIDWSAWGARASFDYTVERGGETIHEKTFYSNFRPWQAVYLRGVGPISTN